MISYFPFKDTCRENKCGQSVYSWNGMPFISTLISTKCLKKKKSQPSSTTDTAALSNPQSWYTLKIPHAHFYKHPCKATRSMSITICQLLQSFPEHQVFANVMIVVVSSINNNFSTSVSILLGSWLLHYTGPKSTCLLVGQDYIRSSMKKNCPQRNKRWERTSGSDEGMRIQREFFSKFLHITDEVFALHYQCQKVFIFNSTRFMWF